MRCRSRRRRRSFPQGFPQPGWVEHDPRDLLRTSVSTARIALQKAEDAGFQVVALGIANQRETALVWDRRSGEPIHPAIVWQDRRTAQACADLKRDGAEPLVQERAGLLLDPYFSATKVGWMLDMWPAPASAPSAANSCSARSTATSSGT